MAREKPCSRAVARGRLQRARGFTEAAGLVEELVVVDDQAVTDLGASLVTLWVNAGIAASDVICCVRLGRFHAGPDHQGATALLRSADKGSEAHLRRLLSLKTPVGYGHKLVSAKDRAVAKRCAEALVERAAETFA